MKIGVAVNNMFHEPSGITPDYNEIRSTAMAAEESGFDSIWLFDHMLIRREPEETMGIWECWTMLSALAEATSRVELGTLVLCNPFRNPALLAKMAHTLDEVSGGRLILGLGAGWHRPEFDAFGFPFDRRVDRFEEALHIVKPLMRGESITIAGDHYQVEDCVVTPLGPRPEGIPLMIGAFRPRMLSLTARFADQWNTAWLGEPHELAERLAQMQNACAAEDRDPASLTVTVGVQVAYPDLGETNLMTKEPLSGSAGRLAEAFHGYESAGADHLLVHVTPTGLRGQERLAEAVRLYRGETS